MDVLGTARGSAASALASQGRQKGLSSPGGIRVRRLHANISGGALAKLSDEPAETKG